MLDVFLVVFLVVFVPFSCPFHALFMPYQGSFMEVFHISNYPNRILIPECCPKSAGIVAEIHRREAILLAALDDALNAPTPCLHFASTEECVGYVGIVLFCLPNLFNIHQKHHLFTKTKHIFCIFPPCYLHI